jgi:WhiB family transcriptional regulator, redox-sensing transcriptional regulator
MTGPSRAVLRTAAAYAENAEWRESAACAETVLDHMTIDPKLAGQMADLWFATSTNNFQAARTTCVRCTVATECLTWAIDNDETDGMYGGLTPEQRARYRQKLGGAA